MKGAFMMINKKLTFVFVIVFVLLFTLPYFIYARDKIDNEKMSSITINYHNEDVVLEDARFSIYFIASVDENGRYTVSDGYSSYPLSFNNCSIDEWNDLAETIKGYISSDNINSDGIGTTDENGMLSFNNILPGLYLVLAEKCSIDGYTYFETPTITSVPSYDDEKSWIYDVNISPKTTRSDIPNDQKQYFITRKVLKNWKNDEISVRPNEIEVQLLCDGSIYDVIKLNDDNNWCYVWDKLPEYDELKSKIEWSVVESSKLKDYNVEFSLEGNTFVITNTFTGKLPDRPSGKVPQMGQLWWPVPVLICGGIVILTIGLVKRKNSK